MSGVGGRWARYHPSRCPTTTGWLLGTPGPAWPHDIELVDTVDRDALGRALRAAEAGWGPVVLGPVIAGDGRAVARWQLRGGRGDLELELALATEGGTALGSVTIVPRSMVPPDVLS